MRDLRRATVAIGVTGAVLAALLAGCGGRPAGRHAADDATPVPITAIRAVPAGEADLVLPARVAAGEEVVVTARHAGRVTALPHREGDRFRAGEPLVAFEAPEAREALAAARAALDAATLRGEQARLQEARMESLSVRRVASQREREMAQSERRDAEAALASARAAFSEVSAALAIPAPFDGVVVRRLLDPGASVGPGQPVLAIRSRAPAEIVAAVPESELDRLARARFAFRSADGPWKDAVLARVDGMTDYATRTRVARLRPARVGEPLEPGAFARVRITGAARPAAPATASTPGLLSIPAHALVRRGALVGVYVVRDGRSYLRWLRIGAADGERIEVLSGLTPDDLIADDPAGLADGRAVEVAR